MSKAEDVTPVNEPEVKAMVAPVTAAGRSGQSLAKAISLSADGHFMCVGLAPTDLINGYASEYGDSNGKGVIEVKINNAAFGSNKIGI